MPKNVADSVVQHCGKDIHKVFRVVKKGQVYFSKEYTRMVKRDACVVLLSNGKVAEINYFIWDRQSGDTFLVYEEIQPDLERPFFYENVGCHVLRMKPERYLSPTMYMYLNY